jgi:hypothetical protein
VASSPKPNPTGQAQSPTERKDAAARAALVPLSAGERPRVITVAAVMALVLGIANLAAYFAGLKVAGARPPFYGVVSYSGLMFVAVWGLWRVRYWAALAMQALLAIIILIFSLLAFTAQNVVSLVIAFVIVAAAGILFWHMVRAMARIQLTARQRSHSGSSSTAQRDSTSG